MEQPEESSSSPAAKFALPVDSEHKATKFNPFSLSAPHMRAFHLSWFSFFCCFCSTFATSPLLPVIRDNLNLTATDIGNAGIASVSGAVFARVIMGTACDLVGPRIASASLILLTAPLVFLTALISSPSSFLLARFFTGFSLACFVSTQFWMSSMFSPAKVGLANSFAAGWGNLGGGAIQLVMPLLYSLIVSLGASRFTAWRIAFLFPGLMQTMSAIAVLAFGQDLPDGSFQQLRRAGAMHKESFPKVFTNAVTNYRSLGVVSGITGGGGNVGAILTQVIFFKGSRYSTQRGISLMGVMIVCCTLPLMLIDFPQWGGMFRGPNGSTTEEDYYASEWSSKEKEKGYDSTSMKFARNSRSERGREQGNQDAIAPVVQYATSEAETLLAS